MPEQCPYCGVRAKRRKTCGDPGCQYKHHLAQEREYFNKYLRKTERRVRVDS